MAKTAKTKASSKKQQSRGVDFKKIKRKLGRKLPPPKNETNTEIKSKAIILPEQSVASEKAGLAVSKKGLTLKELLQQTSHHNAKVRKDALMGLKDLLQKFPDEMKLHKYAIIEKLRERISDDDKLVRESLYQLFKMVILPSIQEDNQGPLVSLMMAYIFSAMKHLSIDVRLMAFKFFDLAVQYYPPTFHSNAEKILQNYKDILQKNQFYIQEKGKLKNALAGLVHCLSLLSSTEKEINEQLVPDQEVLHAFEPEMPTEFTDFPLVISKLGDLVPVLVNCFQDFIPLINGMSTLDAQSFDCMFSILESIDLAVRFFINGDHKNKFEFHQHHLGDHEVIKWDQHIIPILLKKLLRIYPLNSENKFSEKDDEKYFMLNIVFTEIFLHLNGWISPTELLERSLAFIEYAMLEKACSGARFHNVFREKQILRLIPFIPKLLAQLSGDWKSRILQAFTKTFLECKPDLQLKLACLTAIEEMLIISKDYNGTDLELVAHQISWMKELPVLLLLLGDKHPSSSQVVLNLVVRLGQRYLTNSSFEAEFDNMQYLLQEFYSSYREGEITYGAFLRLPRECQELSLCCLYYFSHLDLPLLKSIVSCCLCQELDEFILFRILEVLHSAFKAGRIRTSDYLSFLLTLICRLKVYSERKCTGDGNTRTRDNGTLKSLTSIVCKYLLQMGDDSVVFLTIERAINEQILLEPQLDNACSMLRVLVVFDSKPTRLSDQSIITMSNFLSRYLIDVMLCVPLPEDQKAETSTQVQRRGYYLVPCFFLFERSKKLLKLVLTTMGSTISEIIISLSCGDSNSHFSRDYLARINAIVSVILLISKESKLQETIFPLKEEIVNISNNIYSLQSSEKLDVSIEERHRIRLTKDQLDTLTQSMPTT